jgi:hypothetical protein
VGLIRDLLTETTAALAPALDPHLLVETTFATTTILTGTSDEMIAVVEAVVEILVVNAHFLLAFVIVVEGLTLCRRPLVEASAVDLQDVAWAEVVVELTTT